jgi:hypothetical protein
LFQLIHLTHNFISRRPVAWYCTINLTVQSVLSFPVRILRLISQTEIKLSSRRIKWPATGSPQRRRVLPHYFCLMLAGVRATLCSLLTWLMLQKLAYIMTLGWCPAHLSHNDNHLLFLQNNWNTGVNKLKYEDLENVTYPIWRIVLHYARTPTKTRKSKN